VIVECDQCHARYHYEESRFGGKAAKKLRCSKCRAIFEVVNTRAFEAQPVLKPRPAPEETATRRPGERAKVTPRPERSPAALKLPTDYKLSLAVIAGPDAGRIFPIEKPRVVIGREEVDVVLEDPEISRQHAAVEVAGDKVTVVDLGSSNGTLIGESPVTEAALENQGEFTIGGSTLMLIMTPQ
jgi:predicted Zn finger-like uncharacterized protein